MPKRKKRKKAQRVKAPRRHKKKAKKKRRRKAPARKAARRRAAHLRARPPHEGRLLGDARAGAAVTAAAALVDVGLEKTADSPSLVRVTIQGTSHVVLAPGQTKGAIPQVPVGSYVTLWIEVTGNPGQTATIDVTHAIPSPLKVTIPKNTGQWAQPETILVV